MNAMSRTRFIARLLCLFAVLSIILTGLATAAAPEDGATAVKQAAKLLDRFPTRRGLCAVVGGDPALALEVAGGSELLVHARYDDWAPVQELRKQAADVGLGINRLAVERGSLAQLPHAENTLDVAIVPGQTADSFK